MRIALISHHADPVERPGELRHLGRWVHSLARQGHGTWWLTSDDGLPVLAEGLPLASSVPYRLPPTCRHVVPVRRYGLDRLPLIAAAGHLWCERPLLTRLMTFVELLQAEWPSRVFHIEGTLPAVFMAVYTACVLRVPTVVLYGPTLHREAAPDSFEWQWVTRHANLFLVSDGRLRRHLQQAEGLSPERLWALPADVSSRHRVWLEAYRQLDRLTPRALDRRAHGMPP